MNELYLSFKEDIFNIIDNKISKYTLLDDKEINENQINLLFNALKINKSLQIIIKYIDRLYNIIKQRNLSKVCINNINIVDLINCENFTFKYYEKTIKYSYKFFMFIITFLLKYNNNIHSININAKYYFYNKKAINIFMKILNNKKIDTLILNHSVDHKYYYDDYEYDEYLNLYLDSLCEVLKNNTSIEKLYLIDDYILKLNQFITLQNNNKLNYLAVHSKYLNDISTLFEILNYNKTLKAISLGHIHEIDHDQKIKLKKYTKNKNILLSI